MDKQINDWPKRYLDSGALAWYAKFLGHLSDSEYHPLLTKNKAGYTATLVACGWAGAVLEKVTRASGQEPYAQKAQKRRKSKKGTDRPTDRLK